MEDPSSLACLWDSSSEPLVVKESCSKLVHDKLVDLFISLLDDLTVRDITLLIEFDRLLSNVYVFDAISKEAVNPGMKANDVFLPWPIVWLTAAHNRKHVYLSRRLPQSISVAKAARRFASGLCWHFLFYIRPDST